MKYSVVAHMASPPKVLATFPFDWMASLAAYIYSARGRDVITVATPTDPETVMRICQMRDDLFWENQNMRRERMSGGPLLPILWGLIAKGDDGRWETVHDAGCALDDESQKTINEIMGH